MPKRLCLLSAIVFLLALGMTACGGGAPPCEAASLTAPNLANPSDGMIVDSSLPVLLWTYPDACNPDGYRVDLTDSTYDLHNLGATTGNPNTSWTPAEALVVGRAYWWRVAAVSGSTVGPLSTPRRFIVGPVCEAGELAAPDGFAPEPDQTTMYPHQGFAWTYPFTVCQPEGYRLQVSTRSDFATLAVDKREAEPIPTWGLGVVLDDCTRFYWRVAAISGAADGPWSSVETFRTDYEHACTCAAGELDAPTLISPAPNAFVGEQITESVDPPNILDWMYPGGCQPEGYQVYLYTGYDTSDTSLFGTTDGDTDWNPAAPLETATEYRWRVAALSGGVTGPRPPLRSFFTGPECSTPGSELPAPELVSPVNEAVVNRLYIPLYYRPGEPGCLPDGYAIDLQTDPEFGGANLVSAGALAHAAASPRTYLLTDRLDNCTQYFWRVAAIAGGEASPFSEVWSFFTDALGTCALAVIHEPFAEGILDQPCYTGPGPQWPIVGYLLTGETTPVIARNMAGDWLVVGNLDNLGSCWARQSGVTLHGDLGSLHIYNPPPLPCRSDMNCDECTAAGGTCQQSGAVGQPGQTRCVCP
jgi:hypothetical protein